MSYAVPLSRGLYRPTIERTYKFQPKKSELAAVIMTSLSFFVGMLVIGIGIRVALSLLVITGPYVSYLTYLTDTFIQPFTRISNDSHSMVQISTMIAFCAYYLTHIFISIVSHFVQRTVALTLNAQQTA